MPAVVKNDPKAMKSALEDNFWIEKSKVPQKRRKARINYLS